MRGRERVLDLKLHPKFPSSTRFPPNSARVCRYTRCDSATHCPHRVSIPAPLLLPMSRGFRGILINTCIIVADEGRCWAHQNVKGYPTSIEPGGGVAVCAAPATGVLHQAAERKIFQSDIAERFQYGDGSYEQSFRDLLSSLAQ